MESGRARGAAMRDGAAITPPAATTTLACRLDADAVRARATSARSSTRAPALLRSTPRPRGRTPSPRAAPWCLERRVRVADIAGDPDGFVGDTMTVEAHVEEVRSAFALALDEDAPAVGVDNDLMVHSRTSARLASTDDRWLNDQVRVTGGVQRMGVADIEREIGWDLDPRLEVELESVRPVLIATSIVRLGGR